MIYIEQAVTNVRQQEKGHQCKETLVIDYKTKLVKNSYEDARVWVYMQEEKRNTFQTK